MATTLPESSVSCSQRVSAVPGTRSGFNPPAVSHVTEESITVVPIGLVTSDSAVQVPGSKGGGGNGGGACSERIEKTDGQFQVCTFGFEWCVCM